MSHLHLFSTGRIATLACLLEATAAKPGNVHRGADFEDLGFEDFLVSAEVIGAVIDRAVDSTLGDTIYQVIQQTKQTVGRNTNLGIALLICPLAKLRQQSEPISTDSMGQLLAAMNEQDSAQIYAAINLAAPGGMSQVESMDLRQAAPPDLLDAMHAAADRDLVARQFANHFADVIHRTVNRLVQGGERFDRLSHAIIWAHVSLIAELGDSLIERKCGVEASNQAQFLAQKALDGFEQGVEPYWECVSDLDFWLRSDGHRRNPGSTADLIAAGLFCGIANQTIIPPFR